MADISADYMAFRKMTEDMTKLYEKLGDEIANIGKYTSELDIFWDGAANDAYNSKLSADLVMMGKIVVNVRNTINSADKIFTLYMNNEKNVADLISVYGKGKI